MHCEWVRSYITIDVCMVTLCTGTPRWTAKEVLLAGGNCNYDNTTEIYVGDILFVMCHENVDDDMCV